VQVISKDKKEEVVKGQDIIQVKIDKEEYYFGDTVIVYNVGCSTLNNKHAIIYARNLIHISQDEITCDGDNAKVHVPDKLGTFEGSFTYYYIRICNTDGNEYESDKFKIIRTAKPANVSPAINNKAASTTKVAPKPIGTIQPSPNNPIPQSQPQLQSQSPPVATPMSYTPSISAPSNKIIPQSADNQQIPTITNNNKVNSATGGGDNGNNTNGNNGNAFNGKIGNGNVDNASANEDDSDKKPSKGKKVINTITYIIIFSIIGGVVIFVVKVHRSKRKRNTLNFGTGSEDMKPINEVPFPAFIPSKIIDTDKYIQID